MHMDSRIILAVTIALLVLCGWAGPTLRDHTHGDPLYQADEVEAAKESIALSLMGQLQLSVGDLMWLKSMEYLHVGMIQRMPTRAEEEMGYRRGDAQDVAAGLGHTEGLSMILTPDRDWRGLIGEVERHIRPYSDEHVHDDPVEIIPWYQLAVRLNPNLERLYTLGAFYLADFAKAPAEAREMLEAGIIANPLSFEIHATLGKLLVDYADRLDELEDEHHDEEAGEAEEEADDPTHDGTLEEIHTPEEAYTVAEDLLSKSISLAEEQRRQMAQRRKIFDEFENQIYGEAYLYLSKAQLALGRHQEAIDSANQGYENASKYRQRNLLKVQARVATRALTGEAPDERMAKLLATSGDPAHQPLSLDAPQGEEDRSGQVEEGEHLLDLIGMTPPEDLEMPRPTERDLEVLLDLRAHPFEPPAARAERLGIPLEAVASSLARLRAWKFTRLSAFAGTPMEELTGPGLYVAAGHHSLNFWEEVMPQADEVIVEE